jgi:hypothetical protein
MSKLETSSLKLCKGTVGKKETKETTEASQVFPNPAGDSNGQANFQHIRLFAKI